MARTITGTNTVGITLTLQSDNPVTVASGAVVSKTGTLSALYGLGGGSNSWTIDNSGVLAGGGKGLQLGNTNSYVSTAIVTNRSTGTITGGVAGALIDNSGTALLANAGGSISGGQFGVAISGPGTVTNAAGSQILDTGTSGTSGAAIYLYGGQVYNAGSVTGRSGVDEFLGGTVTNVSGGVITGSIGAGVDLRGPGTVFNGGTISGGGSAGIFLEEGGSVTNLASGTIVGNYGIFNYGFASYGGDVTNAGTIIGTSGVAVLFSTGGGSNYRLTVDPGAVFVGAVYGGGGVVELAPGSSTGTLYGFGSTITNFSTLQFDKGSSWNISGDQGGLGTMSIVGLAAGDVVDLTGFAATAESFSNGTLTLTDSSNLQAALSFPDQSDIKDFQFAPDGTGGTDIAGAGTGQTLNWTSSSGHDWNTATNWSPAIIPGSFDTAVIANPGSTSVTIATGATNVVGDLLINSPDDTLEVKGSLNTVGTVTIDAGSLIDVGTLSASAIKDNALLATQGVQTLDNIPIELGGTLQPQAGGALILGPSEVVTQTGPTAVLDSTTAGGESVINQGTIDASAPSGSLSIAPLNFTNQGTILVGSETATIGFDQGGSLGTWDNTSGTIALSGTASLVLDGSLAASGLGTITGATGVTEAGLLDNAANILTVGTGTPLGTLTLASTGTISGGNVEDPGGGILFNGGTLADVTYQGPMELLNVGASATVSGLSSFLGSDGVSLGTIDLTGMSAALQFATVPLLDNAILNIGNTKAAAVVQASGPGTFAIEPAVTIDSSAAGALATLNVGSGTDLSFGGTLDAVATGGTFTLADSGGTFSNDGTITAGNSDTLDVKTAIAAGSGTIQVVSKGTVDVANVTVSKTQTFDFVDNTGVLRLGQPNKFLASITGFQTGDSIDLTGIKADTATLSSNTLMIANGGTTVATLSLQGDYSQGKFTVASDGATGSAITVTAICYAAGTRILTPRGEKPIERLHRDELVMTLSGRPQPIRWIGRRRVDFRRHPNRQRVLPVRIAAHAFGPEQPKRNLVLSPDHAVYVEGVLIPIRHLINGTTITQIERRAITYYHIELQQHDVLLADGMPAESYLEAGARSAFSNGDAVIQLHPEFTPAQDHYAMLWEQHGYAPLVVAGETLERVRASLAAGSQRAA